MQCLKMITITSKVRTKGYDRKQYNYTAVTRKRIQSDLDDYPRGRLVTVPCGKCAFCLVNRRSSWMFRVNYEMRTQNVPGYFLTLTYNEKSVQRVGEGLLSLRFRDVQLYLKRIRKKGYYAKYICVGEYGGNTHRPHYHMLLWSDCPVLELESEWKNPRTGIVLGSVHFGSLTMQSAMYTLKYIIQPKVKTSEDDPREPTRAQFSRGIGLGYLTNKMYNWHTQDEENPVMFVELDGRKVSLPKYYRNKIFTKHQLQEEAHRAVEESITEKAKAFAKALAQGAGARKGASAIERYRAAREYLQALRLDECVRILKNTKYNQSL